MTRSCRRAWFSLLTALLLATTLAAACGGTRPQRVLGATPTGYAVIDLGPLPLGSSSNSNASGINDGRQVVGDFQARHYGGVHAFLWEDGAMTDLGTMLPENAGYSGANAINGTAQIVGESAVAPDLASHAVLWQGGTKTDLGTLRPGNAGSSAAYAINDAGQIVGESEMDEPFGKHGVLWQGGTRTDLGTLRPGNTGSSRALAINSAGQIVGEAETATPNVHHAVRWQGGVIGDLGTLRPGNAGSSRAHDIDDTGRIVGSSEFDVTNDRHAVLWSGGTIADLGTLGGANGGVSYAYAINAAGTIVGTSSFNASTDLHAVIWQDGELVDLNSRIPANSGWELTEAFDINAAGEIVGVGFTGSGSHGFLLIPAALLTFATSGDGGIAITQIGLAPGAVASAVGPSSVVAFVPGTLVNLAAQPAIGNTFTGWMLDGTFVGWSQTLTLTMEGNHTIVATFAPTPTFSDSSSLYERAIRGLAARGIVRGYGDGTFGVKDFLLRAQMAALIARSVGWEDESWPNPFPDRGSVDADLWRNVGTLAHYDVARGYEDGTYNPTGEVLRAQAISFITRAMVAKGYWTLQPDDPALFANVPASSGHRQDLVTYAHYAGPLVLTPPSPPNTSFPNWDLPVTREEFADYLWKALDSYWSVDRVP